MQSHYLLDAGKRLKAIVSKCLSLYGFAHFNGMEFAKVNGFARHFPLYGDIQLLWKLKIHSKSNTSHTMDFHFFPSERWKALARTITRSKNSYKCDEFKLKLDLNHELYRGESTSMQSFEQSPYEMNEPDESNRVYYKYKLNCGW